MAIVNKRTDVKWYVSVRFARMHPRQHGHHERVHVQFRV